MPVTKSISFRVEIPVVAGGDLMGTIEDAVVSAFDKVKKQLM